MADTYLQEAFNQVCSEAEQPKVVYVVLMERCPFYGGPQEGGWWGRDNIVRAFQRFETEEAARAAEKAVEAMARELSAQARREYGDYCLRTMEWLDARGLDADYLPEPDGESEFYVWITGEYPESTYGSRHWE